MAFRCRNHQSKLKQLSRQFTRCYFPIPYQASSSINHMSVDSRVFVAEKPIIHNLITDFRNNVRFYAAPVQAIPKQEEREKSGPLLNELIKAAYVRLVTEEGHCVVPRREALYRAKEAKLDLVVVDTVANPPVCKIMDFHKVEYIKQIKEKERAKSKSAVTLRKGDCKEVRFSGKTEQKDLKIKSDAVKRLMDRGYRVKCMVLGTEDEDLGGPLSRLSALIEDVAIVESGPRVEKKQAYVVVRHIKYGPPKKGGAKKSKVAGDKSSEVENSNSVVSSINYSDHGPEDPDLEESDMETEDETTDKIDLHDSPSVDKNLDDKKNAWSVSDTNDDFDTVFGSTLFANETTSRSTDKQMNALPKPASSNLNIANSSSHRTILDYMNANTMPSSPPQSSHGTENRYKRSDTRNQFPPTNSMDARGPVTRDSIRVEPQFPKRAPVQLSKPTDPRMRVSDRLEPRFPSPRTHPPSNLNGNFPPRDNRKQEFTGQGTASSSFGIFSKNKEGNPDAGRLTENPNSPNSKPDGLNPGLHKDRPGGWGRFSKESSNFAPNRISKPN